MQPTLFEYVVILHPTEERRKAGEQSRVLVDVTRVLARDLAQVQILASRSIPEAHLEDLDCVTIAVRPF